MMRCLAALLMFLSLSAAAPAQEEDVRIAPRPLQSAFEAIRNGRWDTASRIAERDGPAAVSITHGTACAFNVTYIKRQCL